MSDDPTFFDPKRRAPPPIPDEAVKTDPDSPFAPPPPSGSAKGRFAAPPPDNAPSKYDWGRVEYAKMPIADGPPRILAIVCGGWILFTLFQLYAWLPEEIVVPGCPGIAGITSLLLAVYVWSGKNLARLLAMANAAAWMIGAAIILRTPAYEELPHGTKPVVLVRAAFELFAVFAINRPDCVAYFELRKGYVPKW